MLFNLNKLCVNLLVVPVFLRYGKKPVAARFSGFLVNELGLCNRI